MFARVRVAHVPRRARCAPHLSARQLRSAAAVQREVGGEVPWSAAASALVTRVPQPAYTRLKQKAERDASIGRDKQVQPSHVYACAPNLRELFGSPLSFAYRGHAGPVYAARFSPFHRNVFLTASTDGSLRLYNTLAAQKMKPNLEVEHTYEQTR